MNDLNDWSFLARKCLGTGVRILGRQSLQWNEWLKVSCEKCLGIRGRVLGRQSLDWMLRTNFSESQLNRSYHSNMHLPDAPQYTEKHPQLKLTQLARSALKVRSEIQQIRKLDCRYVDLAPASLAKSLSISSIHHPLWKLRGQESLNRGERPN